MRLAVVAAALGLLWLAPGADAAVTCDSGFTIHEERTARIFGAYRGEDLSLYSCVRGRAVRFWRVSPATTSELFVYGRTGRRLALSLEEFADGGNGIWVGWLDVRTGRRSLRLVRSRGDFTPHPDAVAVGRGGEVAWVYAAAGATYEVFHRRATTQGRRIASVPRSELEPLSLRVAGRTVRWRTRGEQRDIPLVAGMGPGVVQPGGEAAAAQARPACDVGTVLLSDDRVRVFRAPRGVFACGFAKGARAVRIGGPGARLTLARAGRVLAFATRDRGRMAVGTLQIRSRVLRRRGLAGAAPRALAPGADGGLAMLRGGALAYLAATGSGLGPPNTLAQPAPGELDPATLAVTPTAITWRTLGAQRSARASAA